jgi:hypothetical protein
VATGLNRPSDFTGGKRSLMSRLVPGGGIRDTQGQSVLRQPVSRVAARPGSTQHELRAGPAPQQPGASGDDQRA